MPEVCEGVMVHGSLGAVNVPGKWISCCDNDTSRDECGDNARWPPYGDDAEILA